MGLKKKKSKKAVFNFSLDVRVVDELKEYLSEAIPKRSASSYVECATWERLKKDKRELAKVT